MNTLTLTRIDCPVCGHSNQFNLDTSNGDQEYYEDCSACCNPIHCNMHIDEVRGAIELSVDASDEQYF
ncbi:CPXCG motif-containing cysteine-rich protein [Alginatibacterium sediminis]|uniref:CPXCG motif-containing cysteine-rich protein n=1 Tax=Alginatibacterium sediminis TaxID=2164068 RepID=A0A420EHA9_9ALTE|nr:CPXCG motif-containing cysteine-rich protein [Alginatibacterium sediminis]RKF20047.1 CPXCG motif-containing cysteine-rich protein [Alginatibacterium sediminis]